MMIVEHGLAHLRALVPILLLLVSPACLSAQEIVASHITVELVAEHAAIAPGQPFRVGLRIDLEDGWHTYWRNPGDAGLATSFKLALPDGFSASEIEWPFPERFGEAPEVSYGYHGRLVLPVTITPPSSLRPGDTVHIGARASWLVCNEVCIPGKAELSLALPVFDGQIDPTQRAVLFDEADRAAARRPGKINVAARRFEGHYELRIANAPGRDAPLPSEVYFFAGEESVVDHSAAQKIEATPGAVTIRVPISPYEVEPASHLRGVLFSPEPWNGSELRAIVVDIAVEQSGSTVRH